DHQSGICQSTDHGGHCSGDDRQFLGEFAHGDQVAACISLREIELFELVYDGDSCHSITIREGPVAVTLGTNRQREHCNARTSPAPAATTSPNGPACPTGSPPKLPSPPAIWRKFLVRQSPFTCSPPPSTSIGRHSSRFPFSWESSSSHSMSCCSWPSRAWAS